MKRKQNLWIGILAATITFGALFAFAGERRFNKFSERSGCENRECHKGKNINNQHQHFQEGMKQQ
ncbi:MAG TPA: hypothetical protein PK191_05100 [Niabella sp.]|nr:hypothetical protein [Niabella sp.]HOZ96062.1 hypothetical protein [Niabella sp.]HQW13428.1 hypothetical protein [Niabella sp.]HQX18822.1 hypothetical protein [Niabella sp.]HQX42646.1 hypothetical protein [Niabella sp.]